MPLDKKSQELDDAFLEYISIVDEYATLQLELDESARAVSSIVALGCS